LETDRERSEYRRDGQWVVQVFEERVQQNR
jgi:hypothetical protein